MKIAQGLFVARLLVAVLLAAAAAAAHWRGFVEEMWPLLSVAAGIALYDGLQLARRTRTVLCLDVIALTAYLHFSGDIENPIRSAYALPVVAAAVMVSTRFAFGLAGGSILAFAAVVFMTAIDASPIRLPHHHLAIREAWALHELIDPDLTPRWYDFVALHFGYLGALLFGCAYGFGALARKIREKESELTKENLRLINLLAALPEGVALLQPDGRILMANREAGRMMAGETLDALESELGLLRRLREFRGPSEEFESEYRGRILNNILVRTSPSDPVVWVFRDRTEQQRLMAQVVHRSKMANLGLLAAGIAHEIGNPLSSMSAIIQLVMLKGVPGDVAERLGSLRSHMERIQRIVRDIGSFARPSAGRRVRVNLRRLVDQSVQMFRLHRKAGETEVRVAGGAEIWVWGVEDQLIQTTLNLLLNAADASSLGSVIEISLAQGDRDARLCIADAGAGIRPEDRPNLFAPFFTTKEPGEGVGLGLFISDSIVRAHGGRIEVDSVPGKGSRFSVVLPLDERNGNGAHPDRG